jgi:hypothetical protein
LHHPRRYYRRREDADSSFRVYHGEQLLTEVARSTTRPIARFKVRKPEPPRRIP